jgi:hypothetical protein
VTIVGAGIEAAMTAAGTGTPIVNWLTFGTVNVGIGSEDDTRLLPYLCIPAIILPPPSITVLKLVPKLDGTGVACLTVAVRKEGCSALMLPPPITGVAVY